MALRRCLLPEYDIFVNHLTTLVTTMLQHMNGAPIIFYVDGDTVSGSERAIEKKDARKVERRAGYMQKMLEMASHVCGELHMTARDVQWNPPSLRWCALDTLCDLAANGANLKIIHCYGEADPYLAHDGQFAALVVSDDTDFVLTPGVLVSTSFGVRIDGDKLLFETRGVQLVLRELRLNDYGILHLSELVSFVGNDYTRDLLEEPVFREEASSSAVVSVQDWLLAKASSADTQNPNLETKRSVVIDRLVPLVCSEQALTEALEFIRTHHPDLHAAIEFTRVSITRPDVIVETTVKEQSADSYSANLPETPYPLLGVMRGIIADPVSAEDFSTSLLCSGKVILPLTAALVATAFEDQGSKPKLTFSYRHGISYIDKEEIDVLALLPPTYPVGPVPTDEDTLARVSSRLLGPLIHLCPSAREDDLRSLIVNLG